MSTKRPHLGIHTSEDEQILHRLGYAQELFRAMGAFRNFAIVHDHLDPGGLPDVVLPRLPVGRPGRRHLGLDHRRRLHDVRRALDGRDRLDLPTAGGLYYWSSKLGSPGWGWFTGWFNLLGLIGIIGAVAYGLAIYATGRSST